MIVKCCCCTSGTPRESATNNNILLLIQQWRQKVQCSKTQSSNTDTMDEQTPEHSSPFSFLFLCRRRVDCLVCTSTTTKPVQFPLLSLSVRFFFSCFSQNAENCSERTPSRTLPFDWLHACGWRARARVEHILRHPVARLATTSAAQLNSSKLVPFHFAQSVRNLATHQTEHKGQANKVFEHITNNGHSS